MELHKLKMDMKLAMSYMEGRMTKWKGWKELKINRNWTIIYHDGAYLLKCKHDRVGIMFNCCKVSASALKKVHTLRQMYKI